MPSIKKMDADVITIESSRSGDEASIWEGYDKQIWPGVYDIHSPSEPTKEELKALIWKMVKELDVNKLWVNPDCGLKTRKESEVTQPLINMVEATKETRAKLGEK